MEILKTKTVWYILALLIISLLLFALHPGKDKDNSLVELNASLFFDRSRFTVRNYDTFGFLNAEMTVNEYYKITGINLQSDEMSII